MSLLLGLIGYPVSHSLSPALYEAAMKHFGIDGEYRLVELAPDKIEHGIANLIKEKFAGFNVTIPHKQALYHLCAELTTEAKLTKAVNAVKIEDSRLIGHNTDMGGFINASSHLTSSDTKIGCIIGAGGAARAAAWGLIQMGVLHLQILSRNEESANKLALEIKKSDKATKSIRIDVLNCDLQIVSPVPDLVVNCTPIGLKDNVPPLWSLELLRRMNPWGAFFDMVYSINGEATPLMKAAQRLRLSCMDGTGMLAEQAALAFEFFTGKTPETNLLKQALKLASASKEITS